MENTFFNCLNPKIDYKVTTWFKSSTRSSADDCLNVICSCCIKVKTTVHYLVHCLNLYKRKTLLDNIMSVLRNISEQSDSFINNVFLFGETTLAQ